LNIQTKENKENIPDYDSSLPFVKVYKDFPKVYNISDHVAGDRASLGDVYKHMPKVYLLSDRNGGAEKTAIYDRNDRTLAILSPMGSVRQADSRQSKRVWRPPGKPTNSAVPDLKAEKADKAEALLAHRAARRADVQRSMDYTCRHSSHVASTALPQRTSLQSPHIRTVSYRDSQHSTRSRATKKRGTEFASSTEPLSALLMESGLSALLQKSTKSGLSKENAKI